MGLSPFLSTKKSAPNIITKNLLHPDTPTTLPANNALSKPEWTGLKSIKSQITIRASEMLNSQKELTPSTQQVLQSKDLAQIKASLVNSLEAKAKAGANIATSIAILKRAELRISQDKLLEIEVANNSEAQVLQSQYNNLIRTLAQNSNYAGELRIVYKQNAPDIKIQTNYYLSNELYTKWSNEYPCISYLKDLGFTLSSNNQ